LFNLPIPLRFAFGIGVSTIITLKNTGGNKYYSLILLFTL